MAPPFSLLFLLSIFSLLSFSALARPCNTLIISSYTFSLRPTHHHLHRHPDLFAVIATDLRHHHHHPRLFLRQPFLGRPDFAQNLLPEHPLPAALGFSSLKDRTLDILSVVFSLLLGAACGALTAGIMYFVWSFFDRRRGSYRSMDGFSSDEDGNDDDDDLFNPKKKGYVAIPAAPATDSAVKAVPAPSPAKESA